MIESGSNIENVEESESDNLRIEYKQSLIKRDPSFSGWGEEDGNIHPPVLENEDVNSEDFKFEQTLVQRSGLENAYLTGEKRYHSNKLQLRMDHSSDGGDASSNGVRIRNEYEPFDIENSLKNDQRYSSTGANGSDYMNYHGTLRSNSKNSISVAALLKTLFLILVWYTFSTFLTLYNKTLLGDHLGKFPAPLLMNTVHFAMQAVLSKAITWFWSERFQPSIMSWRDYFVRDGLCLSQLYRRPSALQWMLI